MTKQAATSKCMCINQTVWKHLRKYTTKPLRLLPCRATPKNLMIAFVPATMMESSSLNLTKRNEKIFFAARSFFTMENEKLKDCLFLRFSKISSRVETRTNTQLTLEYTWFLKRTVENTLEYVLNSYLKLFSGFLPQCCFLLVSMTNIGKRGT